MATGDPFDEFAGEAVGCFGVGIVLFVVLIIAAIARLT